MEEENAAVEEVIEPTEAEASEFTEEEGAEPLEEATADPAAEPVHRENKVQKRIDEITRARRQAEQEADYWRKVATGEIQPQKQDTQTGDDFIPPGYAPEPTLDSFEDYDKYNRALVRWEAGRLVAEQGYRAEQTKAQASHNAVMSSHAARMEAAKEKYADLDDVFADAPRIDFNETTFAAIVDSDQSADIAYYLAKNPAEAERIIALPVVRQIKEIARLEDRFSASPAQPVKRISKAPTPLNPIGGNGEAAQKDPEKMSDEEWIAHERARVAKLGRRY